MASTDFTPELILGAEELDRQHREVFDHLVEAEQAVRGDAAQARAAFGKLHDAVTAHLAAEEVLMEESVFPERARHKAAHDLFLADLNQLRDELHQKGPTPLVAEWLRIRVPEWLRFHIRVNDAKLGEHLARRRTSTQRQRRTTTRLS